MTGLLSDKTMEPTQEDDLVEDAAVYLAERKYPEGCSANRKISLVPFTLRLLQLMEIDLS